MLASRVAAEGQLGVLAIDYRSAAVARYPSGLEDVEAGVRWLHAHGASRVYVYGDSSGATQAAELLLWRGAAATPPLAGAVLLSAWLDLSDSVRVTACNSAQPRVTVRNGT